MRHGLLGLALMAGCATAVPSAAPPTVATVRDNVQVCVDGGGLRVGEPVRFMRPVCAPLNAKSSVVRCTREPIADGEVVQVDGNRCAEVRLHAGATPVAGDGVELASR